MHGSVAKYWTPGLEVANSSLTRFTAQFVVLVPKGNLNLLRAVAQYLCYIENT